MQDIHLVKKLVYGKFSPKPLLRGLLIMKITFVFILAAFLQVSARGYGQGITLKESNTPLGQVFKKIEKQTDYKFWYNDEALAKSRRVNVDVRNVTLVDVLKRIFENQPLSWTIVEKMVVVKLKTDQVEVAKVGDMVATADPIDIKGKVVNESGAPVEGVTVMVKNTNVSTNTDVNGEFSLSAVDGEAILVFTHVSMVEFELTVSGKKELVVKLRTKVSELGGVEVMNTGYQQISRERATGSFSKLDSANYHRRAGMGIIERLDGTVTGIYFDKKNGIAPIQIRGISSLGGGSPISSLLDPLIVIDNFPMDSRFNINSINPNDVESISVLKDAAAASIWGARAGNGVIVITTKGAKYNSRFQISVTSNLTITEKPDLFYNPRIAISDFVDIEQYLFNEEFYDNDINNTANWPVISPVVEILARRRDGVISDQEANTQIDVFRNLDTRNGLNDHLFRESLTQQHHIGFSGGSSTLGYQFSLGYNQSIPGIRGSNNAEQYTINSSTVFRPISNLEFQVGITFSQMEDKSVSLPEGLDAFPYLKLVNDQGTPLSIPYRNRKAYMDTVGGGALLNWNYNPLDEIRFSDNKAVSRFINFNLRGTYRFTNWLNLSIQYQNINQNITNRNHYSLQTYFVRDLINTFTNLNETNNDLRFPIPKGGILDLASSQSKGYNVRAALNFNKSWAGVHALSAMVTAEASENHGSIFSNRLYGYDDLTSSFRANMDYLTYYPIFYLSFPGSSANIPYGGGYSEQPLNRIISFLTNASYTYRDRYTIYASARRDGSNVFGVNTNNKWKPLWSAGFSWDLSKEKFYTISWMPQFRLRGSYGYSGNINTNGSGKLTISYSPFLTPLTNLPIVSVSSSPNPDLRWEQVRTINIGLDFRLLKNRLYGSFEVFHKKSTDVISLLPFDPTTGVSFFSVNNGSLKGRGFELNLSSINTNGKLKWSTNIGISHAKTIVTKVYNGGFKARDFVSSGQINPSEGRVAFGMSSYRWSGLDPLTGDPLGYFDHQQNTNYSSIFNDSVFNQRFHGSSIPQYSGFVMNSIRWKNFSLSAIISGRFDFYFRKPALVINHTGSMRGQSYTADYYLRWQKPGDEAYTNVPSVLYPVPSAVSQRNEFYRYAEIHVVRGDNIRLQDIRLAYQWENTGRNVVPIRNFQIFFYPNNLNLIIWRADSSYLDPEYSGGTTDPIAAPTPITWTVGVQVSFR
jgi:TonB-dependent starch-binding outer membrane protein SusC